MNLFSSFIFHKIQPDLHLGHNNRQTQNTTDLVQVSHQTQLVFKAQTFHVVGESISGLLSSFFSISIHSVVDLLPCPASLFLSASAGGHYSGGHVCFLRHTSLLERLDVGKLRPLLSPHADPRASNHGWIHFPGITAGCSCSWETSCLVNDVRMVASGAGAFPDLSLNSCGDLHLHHLHIHFIHPFSRCCEESLGSHTFTCYCVWLQIGIDLKQWSF